MPSRRARRPEGRRVLANRAQALLPKAKPEVPADAGGDTKELLTISLRNINRLSNLINNLLDLSKIEAGKIELNKEPANIVELAKEVVFGFEKQAKEKNIEIRGSYSSEVIIVSFDKDKIIQVMLNLIGNSMKFVQQGSVEVSITEDDRSVQCTIADTGPGISPEDMKRVFDKFSQFGTKTSPGVKGTGLGLSISKGLVELHGGRIWVESEHGVGTKFMFSLPKITDAHKMVGDT